MALIPGFLKRAVNYTYLSLSSTMSFAAISNPSWLSFLVIGISKLLFASSFSIQSCNAMMFTTALVAIMAGSAAAASTSTIGLFIDNMDPQAQWAASVINACNSSTTYAVVCTSAPSNTGCSAGAQVSNSMLSRARLIPTSCP